MNFEGEQRIREKYEAVVRAGRTDYALATLKLKRFRRVNRLYGREAGDMLLNAVHCAIERCLAKDEYVAQVNVNYFNILLRFSSDEELIVKTGLLQIHARGCSNINLLNTLYLFFNQFFLINNLIHSVIINKSHLMSIF